MSDPASILVVRLSALGDVVLALPTVEALRARFPAAHLAFLARAEFGGVLRGVAAIDRLLLWKGPGTALPEEATARTWDLAVDLSATGRSRRTLARIRTRRTLRARKETLKRFAFVHLRAFGGARVAIASAMDRMAAALAPLGIDRGGRTPSLPAARASASQGAAGESQVLLAPGGGRDAKRWPAEKFAEVARRLTEGGARVVIVGSSRESALLEEVARGVPAERARVVAGAPSEELPQLVAACDVAVTNDSGLLHVAEACGVPVVALFGPTHPRLGFAPWRTDSVVLRTGIDCSPCDVHGPERCPRGHHRCLRELDVDLVFGAVEARMRGGSAR